MPRAVHRFAEHLIHQVTRRQEKEYLPRPEDGALDRLSRDGLQARPSTPSSRRAIGAPGAGQDGDVPGVLLVHAASRWSRCCGSTAFRSTTRTARATATGTRCGSESAGRRASRILVAAGGAPGLRRRPPSVDERRCGAVGRGAAGEGHPAPRREEEAQATRSRADRDDGASRRDLRAGCARIADGCVGRRLPRPARLVAHAR